jgi:redox-sensitive bicupin YhaK (pirin superfamily)
VGKPDSNEAKQVYDPYHTLVLSNQGRGFDAGSVPQENGVWIEHAGTQADQKARVVVIAGQPLDQEVYQYG